MEGKGRDSFVHPTQQRFARPSTSEVTMTTDYNQIADQYKKAKEQPWRTRIELFSMMNLIGDLSGKKVVDVACGEGWLTRTLRKAGASEVVGVDISEEMIALANGQEARERLGIEYRVEDARATEPPQDFDLAVSNWLLVYAHDREELGVMCRGLARRIKPGGRFVTLTTNPALYTWQSHAPNYRKYGFETLLPESAYEGAPVTWVIHLDDSSFEIENYYMPVAAHEAALHDAGFRDVTFHQLTLAPHPQGTDEGDYWEEIIRYPPAIMIDGFKD
jgi:2-polyprenyl-3-methyl-5-hydroxy-6-metoxy-1,4-benzoquinol methylase